MNIVSAEDAIALGIPPAQLEMVAMWHRQRAEIMNKALRNPKPGRKTAFGEVVTEARRERHATIAHLMQQTADVLWTAADSMPPEFAA